MLHLVDNGFAFSLTAKWTENLGISSRTALKKQVAELNTTEYKPAAGNAHVKLRLFFALKILTSRQRNEARYWIKPMLFRVNHTQDQAKVYQKPGGL